MGPTVEEKIQRNLEWYTESFEKGLKDIIFDISSDEPPEEFEGYQVISVFDKRQDNYKWFICKNEFAVEKVLTSTVLQKLFERNESDERVSLGGEFEKELGLLLGFPPSAVNEFSKGEPRKIEGGLSINVNGMIFVTYEHTIADDINWLLSTHGHDLNITLKKRIARREYIKMELDLEDESNISGMIKGFIRTYAVKRNVTK